jgi:hypothetical protein
MRAKSAPAEIATLDFRFDILFFNNAVIGRSTPFACELYGVRRLSRQPSPSDKAELNGCERLPRPDRR